MSERQLDGGTRRRGGGFTIAETLLTLLILSLVSSALVGGIAFAVRQYRESMLLSEAKTLCSTLTSVVRGELANTGTVTLSGESDERGYREVASFFSRNYAIAKEYSSFISVRKTKTIDGGIKLVEAEDGYGELLLGSVDGETVTGIQPLNSAAYTSYDLGVKVSVLCNKDRQIFDVTLRIRPKGAAEDLIVSSFDVIPLNGLQEG